jgi:hypothetical protein
MEELTDNFAFAYSIALEKIFNEWQADEDSGCCYDNVGHRKTYDFNNILMIYQPKNPGEGWIEEGAIIFTLTKEAKAKGMKFNENSLKTFSEAIDKVNTKLYDSVMNFISKREHMWFETVPTTTFLNKQDFVNQICSITKPLSFEKGVLKLSFKIKWYYMEFNVWGWNPVELIDYRMSLHSQDVYEQTWKAKTLANVKLMSEDTEFHKSYFETLLSNNYLLKKIDYYIDDEEERLKYLLERGRVFYPRISDMKSNEFNPKEFEIKDELKLSGSKRKRKEAE